MTCLLAMGNIHFSAASTAAPRVAVSRTQRPGGGRFGAAPARTAVALETNKSQPVSSGAQPGRLGQSFQPLSLEFWASSFLAVKGIITGTAQPV